MSFDRRLILLGLTAALSGCALTPVYGPSGRADVLQGRVAFDDPRSDEMYFLVQRLEERLGRAAVPAYRLAVTLDLGREDLGIGSDGRRTRYQLYGTARYELRGMATDAVLTSGRTSAFSGYSTTGSTVATLAADRDATMRLMTILADQVIDALLLAAGDLPQ